MSIALIRALKIINKISPNLIISLPPSISLSLYLSLFETLTFIIESLLSMRQNLIYLNEKTYTEILISKIAKY